MVIWDSTPPIMMSLQCTICLSDRDRTIFDCLTHLNLVITLSDIIRYCKEMVDSSSRITCCVSCIILFESMIDVSPLSVHCSTQWRVIAGIYQHYCVPRTHVIRFGIISLLCLKNLIKRSNESNLSCINRIVSTILLGCFRKYLQRSVQI